MRVECGRDCGAQSAREHGAGNGGVGDHEGQHGGHVRMNHARAFRASENAHVLSADASISRRPISGRVSVVMMARANCSKALTSELGARATSSGTASRIFSTRSGAPITPVEQTRICAARRTERLRHFDGGGNRCRETLRARAAIRVARIDDDGANFSARFLQVGLADANRRGFHLIRGENGRGIGGSFAEEQPQIELGFLQAAVHGREGESAGQCAFESGALMRSESSRIFLELDEACFEISSAARTAPGAVPPGVARRARAASTVRAVQDPGRTPAKIPSAVQAAFRGSICLPARPRAELFRRFRAPRETERQTRPDSRRLRWPRAQDPAPLREGAASWKRVAASAAAAIWTMASA